MMTITNIEYNESIPKCIEYEVHINSDDHPRFVLVIECYGQLKASTSTYPFVRALPEQDDPYEYLNTIMANALETYEFTTNTDSSLDNISIFDGLIGLGIDAIKKNFDSDYMNLLLNNFKGKTLVEI